MKLGKLSLVSLATLTTSICYNLYAESKEELQNQILNNTGPATMQSDSDEFSKLRKLARNRLWNNYPLTEGPFNRSMESLNKWECPEWFQNAKLGLWMCWGPQAIPKQGDWYARAMYQQGHHHYDYHVKTYGHPSEFGYKDLLKQFKPDKMDYEQRIKMYKDAGAKYVVMLAVHHDNYDLWDSKYHDWDSVEKYPGRDLVGEFAKAAQNQGMRYGLTAHNATSLSWMQVSHRSDKTGPKAGVPYDGTVCDPETIGLYCPPYKHLDDQLDSRRPNYPPEWWENNWYHRISDLLENYTPDLFYFDGAIPFKHDESAVGRQVIANFYNSNIRKNGKLEAVMNLKNGNLSDMCVPDYERTTPREARPFPWQIDTCIGNWFYNESVIRNNAYKDVEHIVLMLIDVVSKNGNLMLSVPAHPSGEPQPEEIAFLKGLGEWMNINGEAIYETRPWVVAEESQAPGKSYLLNSGHNEVKPIPALGDFRFTYKDGKVYAFFMHTETNNSIVIESLSKAFTQTATINKVRLVGTKKELNFDWGRDGLEVQLPEDKPGKYAWCVEISGNHLKDFKLNKVLQKRYNKASCDEKIITVQAEDFDAGGQLTAYHDTTVENKGKRFRLNEAVDIFESKDGLRYVGEISNGEWLEYTIDADIGVYEIQINAACDNQSGKVELYRGDELIGQTDLAKTNGFSEFKTNRIFNGEIKDPREKIYRVKFLGNNISFDSIRFVKIGKTEKPELYLSDLKWDLCQAFPTPVLDIAMRGNGNPLKTGGKIYSKGIGAISKTNLEYKLDGKFSRFKAVVGIDSVMEHEGAKTSVEFEVYLDGKKAYSSGVMHWNSAPKKINLDVTGSKVLRLYVSHAGDSRAGDRVVWGAPRLFQ